MRLFLEAMFDYHFHQLFGSVSNNAFSTLILPLFHIFMRARDLDCIPLQRFLVINKRPADIAQVVCPLIPGNDLWRLTDPDSFFDLSDSSPCQVILPRLHPLPINDIVSLSSISLLVSSASPMRLRGQGHNNDDGSQ